MSTPFAQSVFPSPPSNRNPLDEREDTNIADHEREKTKLDKAHTDYLYVRLEEMRRLHSSIYPEFNGKNHDHVYEECEKIANTNHLDPKKDPDDVIVSAGTIETKLDALLSHINSLNLSPEVFAFDKNNTEVRILASAIEDIIHDTEIRDRADGGGDEEKKTERQRALFKHPAVFVQEEWLRKFEIRKKLKAKFENMEDLKNFDGFEEILELVFEGPSRTLLYAPNVYLGSMTEYYMDNQPDMFVIVQMDFRDARSRYGKFDNFKFVKEGRVENISEQRTTTIFDVKWRLSEVKDKQVEVITYMCKERDEFQILINGVTMLPAGFPLSAVTPSGGYNIAKQVFRPINAHFPYGKAFVQSGSVKELSALIDEMLKLFVLKTRKSITPAYANNTGRIISRKTLSPGRISMLDAGSLVPIAGTEVQGVVAGEVGVFNTLQDLVNKSTVSEQFTGQQGKAGQTATETIELQRQSRLSLSLAVLSTSLLEKKLAYLRIDNILKNWFLPIGEHIEEIGAARKLVKRKTFRKTNREVAIEGEGPGAREVVVTEGRTPTSVDIRAEENAASEQQGRPVRKIFLNSEGIRNARLHWYVVINPKEKESSPFFKVMFREMLTDVLALVNLGAQPNLEGIEEEFSRVWRIPQGKLFTSGNLNPAALAAGQGGAPQIQPPNVSPQPAAPAGAGGGF